MQLLSNSLTDQAPIPEKFAFAVIDPDTHVSLSSNINPHLAGRGPRKEPAPLRWCVWIRMPPVRPMM